MKRPRLYHRNCPSMKRGEKGYPNPEMAIHSDESVVFVSTADTSKLVVRIPFVCPECGWTVWVDL